MHVEEVDPDDVPYDEVDRVAAAVVAVADHAAAEGHAVAVRDTAECAAGSGSGSGSGCVVAAVVDGHEAVVVGVEADW